MYIAHSTESSVGAVEHGMGFAAESVHNLFKLNRLILSKTLYPFSENNRTSVCVVPY